MKSLFHRSKASRRLNQFSQDASRSAVWSQVQTLEERVLLSGTDTTPPIVINTVLEDNTLIVTFSEDMAVSGPGSVLDKANWQVRNDGTNAIPSGALITFSQVSANKYEARIPVTPPAEGQLLTLFARGTIQDLSGNFLDGQSTFSPGTDYFWTPISITNTTGFLDGSYGSPNGAALVNYYLTTPRADYGSQVVYDASTGKYTVAGVTTVYDETAKLYVYRAVLMQFNSDGSLDTSFGSGDGKQTTTIPGYSVVINSLAIDPIYGIVVGGNITDSTHSGVVILRYTLSGQLVTSFGSSGVVYKFGQFSTYNSNDLAIDSINKRIVIAGWTKSAGNLYTTGSLDAIKVTDGSSDLAFNGSGHVDYGAIGWSTVKSVICQADGTVLVAGTKVLQAGFFNVPVYVGVGLSRLRANGSFDSSFAGGGATFVNNTSNLNGGALRMIIRNNRILICAAQLVSDGANFDQDYTKLALEQFTMNGILDASFGSGGISSTITRNGHISDFAVDSYGSAMYSGNRSIKVSNSDGSTYYRSESALFYTDPVTHQSKERNGGATYDFFNSIVVQPDGKIVLAGTGFNSINGSTDFRLDRLTSSYQPDYSLGGNNYFILTDSNEILTPARNTTYSFTRQADGKLIVYGYVWNGASFAAAISRLNIDGSLDTDFGIGGRYVFDWGSGNDYASAVVVQPNGKIVVAVNSINPNLSDDTAFMLLQLASDGKLEKVFVDPLIGIARNAAYDLEVLPDGKLIVVGKWKSAIIAGVSFKPSDFLVMKLNADLTPDTSFGVNNQSYFNFSLGSDNDEATNVTVDPQGRIYVAGWSKSSSTSDKSLSISRLKSNGTLDTTFNGTGKRTMTLGYLDTIPVDLKVDSSSRLVIAANVRLTNGFSLVPIDGFDFVRLTESGQLDTTFDGDGILERQDVSSINGFAIQPDGKFVVAGNRSNSFRVMRFNPTGTPDTSFSNDGYEDYQFSQGVNTAAGLVLMPNGNIAVVGTADPVLGDSDTADFAVLMVQGDGPASVTLSPLAPVAAGNRQGFIAKAFDPALDDNAAYFVYNIDWNNDTDGTHWYDEHIVGTNQLTFYHTFSEPGVYPVVVSVTDRDGKIGPRITLYITVPEDDAPVVTDTETTLVYDENKLLLLAPGATLTDQLSPEFEGGSITVSPTGFFDQNDRLSIRNQGTGAGQIGVNGSSVYYANTLIGTFTGGNANVPLVILLNAAATPAITQALIKNLTFEILSDSPVTTQRSIQIVVNDGDGKTSTPVDKTILVFSINDAPLLDPAGDPRLDSVTRSMVLQGQNVGTLVSDLLNRLGPLGSLTDADASALRGIAVFGLGGTTNGTWEFCIDGGTNWGPFYTPSQTNARLLAADANTRIRFVPKSGVKGVDATISFVAWDRVSGSNSGFANITQRGGSTPFSNASETATISVINSAPDLNTAGSPSLDSIYRNQSNTTNQGTLISDLIARLSPLGSATDADTGDLLGIAINGLTGTGNWQFTIDNGTTWSPIGATGNSDARLLAVDPNTRIRYLPPAGFLGEAKIAFVAWDRTAGTNGSVANVAIRGGATPYSLNFEYASLNVISPPLPNSVGVFRSGKFYFDSDSNRFWDAATGSDQVFGFGSTTDTPLVGDWNGDGVTDIGVWRSGKFYLDANGNRTWNDKAGGDWLASFGAVTDIPIAGDWNGDGITDIGAFRNGVFFLDANGNQKWDGTSNGDLQIGFGMTGDLPVIGDWNGDGKSDIGIYRGGRYYLDANGNRAWNNLAGGDVYFNFGTAGDKPIAGDWNADGKADVGIVRNGMFYLDINGNRAWNNTSGGDAAFLFGTSTDTPLVGLWRFSPATPESAPGKSSRPPSILSNTLTNESSTTSDSGEVNASGLQTLLAPGLKKSPNVLPDAEMSSFDPIPSASKLGSRALMADAPRPTDLHLLDLAFEDSRLLVA